ncbi:MAG: hypothetical protein GC164_16475 [Phycisphaera sp.]|nr:hypothetical protein [Phycisphaera sp.]
MSQPTPPTRKPLIVFGSGGHGLVVAETAAAAGFEVLGFYDDDPTRKPPGPWKSLSNHALHLPDVTVIVAIGDNATRQRVQLRTVNEGCELSTVVHPRAIVSPSAKIGKGVFIGPNAVVHSMATLHDGVIVNSGAIVEHHCEIGAFAHVAPGCQMGGSVKIGERSLVGVGASIRPGLNIGQGATLGTGAVVVSNVAEGDTVVGNPARTINP